jgi:hypothetical protein
MRKIDRSTDWIIPILGGVTLLLLPLEAIRWHLRYVAADQSGHWPQMTRYWCSVWERGYTDAEFIIMAISIIWIGTIETVHRARAYRASVELWRAFWAD